MKDLLEALESDVCATNEPKRIKCGAPDYVIERAKGANTFTVGYVEAKDAGMNLDEIERDSRLNEPKTREGKQLKCYLHGEKRAVGDEVVEGSNRGERHQLELKYAKLVQMYPVMYTVQHRT